MSHTTLKSLTARKAYGCYISTLMLTLTLERTRQERHFLGLLEYSQPLEHLETPLRGWLNRCRRRRLSRRWQTFL
jgi:hypothetical protein